MRRLYDEISQLWPGFFGSWQELDRKARKVRADADRAKPPVLLIDAWDETPQPTATYLALTIGESGMAGEIFNGLERKEEAVRYQLLFRIEKSDPQTYLQFITRLKARQRHEKRKAASDEEAGKPVQRDDAGHTEPGNLVD